MRGATRTQMRTGAAGDAAREQSCDGPARVRGQGLV